MHHGRRPAKPTMVKSICIHTTVTAPVGSDTTGDVGGVSSLHPVDARQGPTNHRAHRIDRDTAAVILQYSPSDDPYVGPDLGPTVFRLRTRPHGVATVCHRADAVPPELPRPTVAPGRLPGPTIFLPGTRLYGLANVVRRRADAVALGRSPLAEEKDGSGPPPVRPPRRVKPPPVRPPRREKPPPVRPPRRVKPPPPDKPVEPSVTRRTPPLRPPQPAPELVAHLRPSVPKPRRSLKRRIGNFFTAAANFFKC